jgi:hypothetical protein
MATTTTNFGWDIPQSTDLVKDGATAIAALGQDIDTALVDLKGGTTGQILAKASNTDLDYSWVTNDVGDITEVTAGTGLTGGGTSGAVTLSFDQANYGGGQYAAGKNKIINGDFGIWQRGTSFTTSAAYTADRFVMVTNPAAQGTVSQQTFTPGTAPVAGYENQFFLRYNSTSSNIDPRIFQPIEDVRTFAGQIVTVSFWAKSATADALSSIELKQIFGGGGSTAVDTTSGAFTITSSWARYSTTLTLPSISGKTIGTNSNLRLTFDLKNSTAFDFDIWGVQIEAGSTASPFQTATGTKQGELAACQRYYWRQTPGTATGGYGVGQSTSTTAGAAWINLPVQLRALPSSVEFSNLQFTDYIANNNYAVSSVVIGDTYTPNLLHITFTTATMTSGRFAIIRNATSAGYIGVSAEL